MIVPRLLRFSKIIIFESWENALLRYWKTGHNYALLSSSYNTNSQLLQRATSFPQIVLCPIFNIIYTLDLAYLVYICHSVSISTVSAEELTNFYIDFLTRFVAWCFAILNTYCAKDLSYFYNTMLSTSRKFGCKSQSELRFDRFMSITVWFGAIQPIFPVLLHLTARHSRRYWPSQFLSLKLYNNLYIRLFYALNELMLSYVAIYNSGCFTLPITAYNALGNCWIKNLRYVFALKTRLYEFILYMGTCFKHSVKYVFRENTMKPKLTFQDAVWKYKGQCVLNRIFNTTYSRVFMPLTVGIGMTIGTLLQGSVLTTSDRIPIIVLLNCIFAITLLLTLFRYIFEEEGRLKSNSAGFKKQFLYGRFRKPNDTDFYKPPTTARKIRVVKSCPDLKLLILGNHGASEETFAAFVNAMTDATVNYVLAVQV